MWVLLLTGGAGLTPKQYFVCIDSSQSTVFQLHCGQCSRQFSAKNCSTSKLCLHSQVVGCSFWFQLDWPKLELLVYSCSFHKCQIVKRTLLIHEVQFATHFHLVLNQNIFHASNWPEYICPQCPPHFRKTKVPHFEEATFFIIQFQNWNKLLQTSCVPFEIDLRFSVTSFKRRFLPGPPTKSYKWASYIFPRSQTTVLPQ